jgi:hypothetical protein
MYAASFKRSFPAGVKTMLRVLRINNGTPTSSSCSRMFVKDPTGQRSTVVLPGEVTFSGYGNDTPKLL